MRTVDYTVGSSSSSVVDQWGLARLTVFGSCHLHVELRCCLVVRHVNRVAAHHTDRRISRGTDSERYIVERYISETSDEGASRELRWDVDECGV